MLSRNVLKNEKTDNFQGFYLRSAHLEPNAWLNMMVFILIIHLKLRLFAMENITFEKLDFIQNEHYYNCLDKFLIAYINF